MSQVAEVDEVEGIDVETVVEVETDPVDNSKHRRLTVDVNGVTCERIWGYCLLPVAQVREFAQYCRDTERKTNDLIAPIIAGGVADLFDNEITPTAAEREDARKVKLPNSEEAIAKQEAKLIAQQEKIAAQLQAVKARAAALRGDGSTVASEDVLSAVVGHGKNGKGHGHGHGKGN